MNKQLSRQGFTFLIENAPLVSIDICIVYAGKILLGKRANAPARNYYFTPGGRIYKNEAWQNAIERITAVELGLDLKANQFKLMGVWDHFYEDSVFNEKKSTHYVNLPHFVELNEEPHFMADEQHESLSWFNLHDCEHNSLIHPYTQNYIYWIIKQRSPCSIALSQLRS
ncbi:GDP-mannose mannosyl hydrolase wbdQ/wbhG [Glaciecola punicea ACAM 611]|uniref:GDP-mannose mannosyl hydrolase wbdQ/wbhG n=1 Tax=Glaciecola punicea ACAM 611 TaxID=1121923 RepID=H5TF59_9ALTE|nr:NUDIX domain-containing protein [Glaciecola punicea]GAB56986.1 GDP-mannose mannosyl hydrolase wbdQ/wbhG [Glaciecola punicea ACAM 611]